MGKRNKGCKVNVFWPIMVHYDSFAFRVVECDVQVILGPASHTNILIAAYGTRSQYLSILQQARVSTTCIIIAILTV